MDDPGVAYEDIYDEDDEEESDKNGFEKLMYLSDDELYELAKMYVEKADRFLLVDIVVAGREAFFGEE